MPITWNIHQQNTNCKSRLPVCLCNSSKNYTIKQGQLTTPKQQNNQQTTNNKQQQQQQQQQEEQNHHHLPHHPPLIDVSQNHHYLLYPHSIHSSKTITTYNLSIFSHFIETESTPPATSKVGRETDEAIVYWLLRFHGWGREIVGCYGFRGMNGMRIW